MLRARCAERRAIALVAVIVCAEAAATADRAAVDSAVLDYVNPFIGTAGDHGQLHPAATLPFGMIQMGPESPGKSHSGYDYNQTGLLGFTHNRQSGVGCRGSGGNVLVRADYETSARGDAVLDGAVVLDKTTEVAAPGYYSVNYGNDNIRAEMTVSQASGWQRYHFPKPGSVRLTVDLSHAHHRLYGAQYSVGKDGVVLGSVSAATVCDEGRYRVYFSMKASKEATQVVSVTDQRLVFRYEVEADESLLVQTAFSPVDAATADRKRLAEANQGGFDQIKRVAQQRWQKVLGKFTVAGDPVKRTLFYTHLYRVYLSPYRLAERGERYRGSDGKLYRADTHDHYFGWSIWDTFRTKFPLLTLIEPETMADITASLAVLYTQDKSLWATDTEPYLTVRTEHAGIVLLDAWRKGITSFDAQALLPRLAAEADSLPRKSPDQILEAAYDDWAVGTFARLLNQEAVAETYLNRAAGYRRVWNEKFRVMNDASDIMHGDGLYEGTLWQYRWFVPFDTAWIIKQLGGAGGFAAELQTFFDRELFNMGNQPDIQAPFMFNFTGAAWRTQKQVYDLLNRPTVHWYGTHDKKATPFVGQVFRAQPEGFIPEMDDDDGTMTAWYVLAAMGLYPAAPGIPVYTLHTPGFARITLALDSGKTFTITASDPDKPYIRSVSLNGKALNRAWLTHAEIMQGGELAVVTSARPNPDWGVDQVYTTSLGNVFLAR